MRKLLLIAALVILLRPIVRGGQDQFGSPRPAIWRSSRTASADSFVLVASGPVVVHSVIIGTVAVNSADAYCAIYNSTSAASAASNINITTAVFINTSVSAPFPLEYDIFLSSGLVYNKKGIADINIMWDFLIPINSRFVKWQP